MNDDESNIATPLEEIIRRLIKRILFDCQLAGAPPVSDTLAAFTVKAVVLSRRHACLLENLRRETEADRLVALCVNQLSDTRSPAANLVRMQVFFETNYMTRTDVLSDYGHTTESRLGPVLDTIASAQINTSEGATREELELLYRHVVAFTVMSHDMGDPANDAVELEATAALRSVFPPPELGNFLALPAEEKRYQLGELADIVAGVRLFNRDAGKGGHGIDDLPLLLEKAVSALRADMDSDLQNCTQTVARYNALVRQHVTTHSEGNHAEDMAFDAGNHSRSPSPPTTTEEDDTGESLSARFIRICREIAGHHRQSELYIRQMLADVGRIAAQLIRLREAMNDLLHKLHSTIDISPAVPANVVLPLFVDLADVWRGFQVETVCLSTVSTLRGQLQAFSQLYSGDHELVPQMWLEERLKSADVVPDLEHFERNAAAMAAGDGVEPTDDMVAEILPIDRLKNYFQLPIQYNRMCPHALVAGGGQLVVGDPALGVVSHEGRYYLCSTPVALAAFARAPHVYTDGVLERARAHAELIHLLSLDGAFSPDGDSSADSNAPPPPTPLMLADQGVQTELHPPPAPVDPELSWNEWTMRRRALLLADLRGRRTHAAQTEKSHLRRDAICQMFPPADVASQTRRDACTKVPRPQNFLYGLRGRSDARHGTVDLTPSIEED